MSNVFISSEIGSQWRTILGHPQLIEYMGICVLGLARGSDLRGSDVSVHSVKKIFGLDFLRDFSKNILGESVGQITNRE